MPVLGSEKPDESASIGFGMTCRLLVITNLKKQTLVVPPNANDRNHNKNLVTDKVLII